MKVKRLKKSHVVSIVFVLIFVVSFALVGGVLTLLYPVNYKKQIEQYSDEFNLDAALVASVINVESGFNKNAQSSAGAIGLMQLMPSTAREIADKLGIENFSEEQLFDPDINIRMGCFYLNYLNNLFNNNQANVLAGYNAGLSNVADWLQAKEFSQDGVVLLSTPYNETNNFIARVNRNYNVYKFFLKVF